MYSILQPIPPHAQLEHELMYAPGFQSPMNLDYAGYCNYVHESLPPETPYLYGLHPNAEIGFLAQTSEHMFQTVLEMQPRDTSGGGGGGVTREEKVRYTCMWPVKAGMITYVCIPAA